MKILYIFAVSVLLLFVAGCAEEEIPPEPNVTPEPQEPEPKVDPVPPPPPSSTAPSSVDVQMVRGGFDPEEVTIAVGGTISWSIGDTTTHKLTLVGVGPIGPTLRNGDKFDYTFDEAGSYEIVDIIFKKKMVVTVE
ncbi:hypothetical protein ACFLZX_03305 [Nanoarchaeota archaeon]